LGWGQIKHAEKKEQGSRNIVPLEPPFFKNYSVGRLALSHPIGLREMEKLPLRRAVS
jgi:hypothetical protein